VNVDYSVPTQGYVPNANANFNYNSNSDGTQAPNPWANPAPLQPQPPAVDFLQPDMGFDWMNWMSTANVSMGPVEEQYGVNS
jgi:hypothetical protein